MYSLLRSAIVSSLIMVFVVSIADAQQLTPYNNTPKPLVEGIPFSVVEINESTPEWAIKLYQPHPNIYEIQNLYDLWRQDYPEVVNGHTRNYKHFMHHLSEFDAIGPDGYIIKDYQKKYKEKLKSWQKEKLARADQSTGSIVPTSGISANTDWVSLGPFIKHKEGGDLVNRHANIYSIAQSESNPNILYSVSEAGGTVFKTTDKGANWSSPNDNYTFGGERPVAIDPTDPNIVWVASSDGIFKSIDGALSWTEVYSKTNSTTSAIIVHPTSPNIVLAGGIGRSQSNIVGQVVRTTNGGSSWTEVLSGKIYDIRFHPTDPDIVYALKEDSTTNQIDFYKSTDNGVNWTQMTNGWPNEASISTRAGRMTTSEAQPDLIYCFIGCNWTAANTNKVKVMKSTDAGASWTTVLDYDNDGGVNQGQGYFDWDIEASDNDPNIVFFGTQNRFLTTDGFATTNWAKVGSVLGHADVQEVLFIGNDLWVANDGGIIKFTDETFDTYEVLSNGINAVSFWYFDQGWHRDAQAGCHYHNGTSARQETYDLGQYLNYGGSEPSFAAIKHPNPDKAWSKGYGEVNGRSLPDGISDPVSRFNYNIVPNASVGSTTWKESEVEVYPLSYNTHFTGSGNTLWRSDDFGATWTSVRSFGGSNSKVTKIEISRANPDVMYVAVFDPSGYSLFKSTNLGQSFTQLTGPSALNSAEGVMISVDQEDENTLFMCGRYQSHHIWKSTNGGSSWTDIYSNIFVGHALRAIHAVPGTNGGVYVLSLTAAFYRNNTMGWQLLDVNMPVRPQLRDIKPYYKGGKIRVAGDGRGVWSADLFEPPSTVAQATVNTKDGSCARDTFYFDDFSIYQGNPSWSWSFPGATYVSATNVRNPKVMYPVGGPYTATMTITTSNGSFQSQIDITVGTECSPEEVPGFAVEGAATSDFTSVDGFDIADDSDITLMAWIKTNGIQDDYDGIIFGREASGSHWGLNFRGNNNNLGFHWPGTSYWQWNSGLHVEPNVWNHVALVKTQNVVTLYVNGMPASHNGTHGNADYKTATIRLGAASSYFWSRNFEGIMDEVAIYKKAMTTDEIREQMHLTKYPQNDPDLVHYYQWNNPSGIVMDRAGNRHAVLNGSAVRVQSTGPFAGGVSDRLAVTAGGTYNFLNTEVDLTFPQGAAAYPNGDLIVSRLTKANPDKPAGSPQVPDLGYWVIRNYGTNSTFDELTSIKFGGLTGILTPANQYEMYKRLSNDDGDTWGTVQDKADQSGSNFITFSTGNGITSFSQFTIVQGTALPIELLSFSAEAISDQNAVKLSWTTTREYNNSYFEIERSKDGIHFESIGSVPTKNGNSVELQKYTLMDFKPLRSINYYRLKQVDVDGQYSYSDIQQVMIRGLAETFVVAPNPYDQSTGQLNVLTSYEGDYKFSLFDPSGKAVVHQEARGDIQILLPKLAAGVYTYRIKTAHQIRFRKLVIVR